MRIICFISEINETNIAVVWRYGRNYWLYQEMFFLYKHHNWTSFLLL